MKNLKKLSTYLILPLLVILFISVLPGISEKKQPSPDTSGQKITQIKIGEQGIIIKTQEGKEITEKQGEITLGKEGIKIKTPEGIETTGTEIKIDLSPKHTTTIELNGGGIVKFGKDIVIDEDEKVAGDVVALGGDIWVKGTVEGEAVSIGGNIHVSSTGVIEDNVTSIGGDVIREPGAIIKGESTELSFIPLNFLVFRGGSYFHRGIGFLFSIFMVLFLFFLGVVILALVPKNVQKIKNEIHQNVWKSGLIGLLGEILILPVFILLLITIIGIPVALIILPLFVLLGMLLGYTSVFLLVGEKFKESTNLKPQTQIMTLALGILVLGFISLFASFIEVFAGLFSPFSLFFAILGFLIIYVSCTIGFGGAILTLLGTRPKEKPVSVAAVSNSIPSQPQTPN